jgi:branched-chain amino acid aminotransferase
VALARATAAGASEALFLNTVGDLCEGTGSNVFLGFGSRLVTPPLSSGCLAGVTRALLLEELAAAGHAAVVEDVPGDDLARADEVLLVSTTRDVQPVRRIDGRELPACPGPLTRRAAEVWDRAFGSGARADP